MTEKSTKVSTNDDTRFGRSLQVVSESIVSCSSIPMMNLCCNETRKNRFFVHLFIYLKMQNNSSFLLLLSLTSNFLKNKFQTDATVREADLTY